MSLDFSQYKSLTVDGINLKKLYVGKYNNAIFNAIDTDGSHYNGCGYIEGYRLNSSGTLTAQNNTVSSGFIPCTQHSVIRMSGTTLSYIPSGGFNGYLYLQFYDSDFALLGGMNWDYNGGENASNIFFHGDLVIDYDNSTVTTDANGCTTFQMRFSDEEESSQIAYFRINGYGEGENIIVTVDSELIPNVLICNNRFYKNWVPYSTEADGITIYNDGLGYKEGYRLSSSGAEKTQSNSVTTGYIPSKNHNPIYMKGATWGTTVSDGYCYIAFYDSNFSLIATVNKYRESSDQISNVSTKVDKTASSIIVGTDGITTFNIAFNTTVNIAYIRISATGNGVDFIVTVNEEII